MQVAIILHAHLPWVRHATPWSVEERWFHDARWTCYPRLLDIAERRGGFSWSISPPLLAMLADPALTDRFEQHRAALVELNRTVGGGYPAAPVHQSLLDGAGGDLVARLRQLRGVELWTSAATHAYLPGWGPRPHHIGAQLRIGRALFEAILGRSPEGRWLPECAIDATVERHLGAELRTVVAQHALPRPVPSVGASGVQLLPRDREITLRVWSRRDGYPGRPELREFHRDLGHVRDVAPFGAGTMTGLKVWAIGGEVYDPERARRVTEEQAEDFVARLAREADGRASIVVAFDAELFGHWWFEGPWFLEAVLERIATHPRLEAVPASRLSRGPRVRPLSSSWGHGGDHRVWIGPTTASWWRHLHRTGEVVEALGGRRGARAETGATARAIVELLQLQASDWPFLIDAGTAGDYPERRLAVHHRRAWRWAAVAAGQVEPTDLETALLTLPRDGPFAALSDEALVQSFVG